jgi:pSer/pThr/pTyr-binding forkhead associated (FHA) protein
VASLQDDRQPIDAKAIGIVCGQCDQWCAVGITVCPECANELALGPPQRSSSMGGVAASPALAAAAPASPATKDAAAPKPAAAADAKKDPAAGTARWGPGEKPADKLADKAGDKAGAKEKPAEKPATGPVPKAPQNVAVPPVVGGAPAGRSGAYSFATATKSEFADLSQEELMEQARNYVCRSCSSGVPTGHKFCGRCGTGVPLEILNAQTLFFGDMQNPAKAKLILIRGEGMDGLSFHLKAEQHIVGRNGQLVFPDDPFVSPKHANFFYRDAKLVVRDEGSLNGVYIRVRGTVDIGAGDTFLAGEQLFRLDPMPRASDGQDPDGTYFYSSPKHPSPFRLTQMLQGGAIGMSVCARGSSLQIGREGGDLNFPMDLYMSGSHCRIEETSGKFTLTDLNSRNGTYVRIKAERDLAHGDYLFIGRKLLRVELNTN